MKLVYEIRIGVPSGWHIAVTKPLCKRKAKKYILGLFKYKEEQEIHSLHFNPKDKQIPWVVCFATTKKDVIHWFKNNRS